MQLLKCHVEGFGVLSQYEYTFSEGLNVICAPNGFGKTTLAAFCKAMLYGLPNSRKGASDNERMHYLPWSGGKFGGWLEFSKQGENYRVERFFGTRAKEDTVRVIALATGLETDRFPEPLGESLFGLDVISFQRSAFLPENDTPVMYTDMLGSRLNGAQTEDNAYSEAMNLLTERRKRYESLSGKRGRIADLQSREAQCARTALEADACRFRLTDLMQAEEKCKQIGLAQRAAYEQAVADEKRAQETAVQQAYAHQAEQLQSEIAAIEAKLQPIEAQYPQGIPDAASCRTCAEQFIAWEATRKAQSAGKEENSRQSELQAHEEQLRKKLSRLPWGLWLLTAFFAALGGCIYAMWPSGAMLSFGIAALFLLISLIAAAVRGARRHQLEKSVEGRALIAHRQEVRAHEQKRLCPDSVKDFCAHFGLPIAPESVTALRKMEQDAAEWSHLMEAWQAKSDALKAFLAAHPMTAAKEAPHPTEEPSVCLEALQRTRNQMQNLLQEKAQCEADLRAAWAAAEEREIIRERREACEAERDCLDLALQFMEQAQEKFSAQVLNRVKYCFGRYAARCFGHDIGRFDIDTNFGIWLERNGARHGSDVFSRGSRDLLAICLRLALVASLYEDEKPFLLLDDPFVHLDAENRTRLAGVLKDIATHTQVICLSCRDERKESLS